jgi:hypothetical protein
LAGAVILNVERNRRREALAIERIMIAWTAVEAGGGGGHRLNRPQHALIFGLDSVMLAAAFAVHCRLVRELRFGADTAGERQVVHVIGWTFVAPLPELDQQANPPEPQIQFLRGRGRRNVSLGVRASGPRESQDQAALMRRTWPDGRQPLDVCASSVSRILRLTRAMLGDPLAAHGSKVGRRRRSAREEHDRDQPQDGGGEADPERP